MNNNTVIILFILATMVVGCNMDPRNKTIWDYIGSETADANDYRRGVEMLHQDLIKHGYMAKHDCFRMNCVENHQSTHADIERINSLLGDNSGNRESTLGNEPNESDKGQKHFAAQRQIPGLEKMYANKYFSFNYPSSWRITQEDSRATANTVVAVQVMQSPINNIDFCPNINIIVSSQKWTETTSALANISSINNKKVVSTYKEIGINDIKVGGCYGSLLQYTVAVNGYKLRGSQYIVKKNDNTVITITATTDANKHWEQIKTINAILNSMTIK